MFNKVKQAIRVGRNVTDMMRLPCVFSCYKRADGTFLYRLLPLQRYVTAHEGQWLCEDYNGNWTVTDEPPQAE
jgi:hypothetical protein